MPDEPFADPTNPAEARQALALLAELQPDLRAAALLDTGGNPVAASDGDDSWVGSAHSLLGLAGVGPDAGGVELHVATPKGEVFAVWEQDLIMVAIAERFVLASLIKFDMRTALRRMQGGTVAA